MLAVYGFLEIGIGVYALLFPLLFRGIQAVSLLVPHGAGGLGFAFDVVLSALLIGPPSVLMGGTIPMLTQALTRSLGDATRIHAMVYACNTAGAFAGALAAGFWLVPSLGLVGVLVAMGCVNLAAGAVFAALGWPRREPVAAGAPAPSTPRVRGFASFAGVALLIGFAMMVVQTVLIRMGALAFGSSPFTFSMIVAVFVLCIALGSFAVSALPRIPRWLIVADLWALVGMLLLLYLPLDDAPYWAHVLRSLFRDQTAAFYPYFTAAFLAVLLAIGPAVTLSGATLPLIFHELRREVSELGDVAGRLYSWNTVGSFLGALIGGYALLFWLDLHQIYRVAVLAVVAAATIVSVRVLAVGRTTAVAVLLVPAVLLTTALPGWDPERLASGLFRTRAPKPATYDGPDAFYADFWIDGSKVAFYDDDPAASVAVLEGPPGSNGQPLYRSILSNGKSDGSVFGDYITMAMAALLPALIADKAERAFVIGYGTGVTVGEFASLDSAREVVVAEISPGVVRAAPLFDYANRDSSSNPKVQLVVRDAYRALLRSEGTFDVIVSEPSNPWVAGVEMLFSTEFLEAARDHLSPGGVYAQWFHAYETDSETISMVFRTYARVFDHVAVWYTLGPDLILLGIRDPDLALDLRRMARRMARPDFKAAFARSGIESFAGLLAHELLPLGVIHAAGLEGPPHTLLRPRLNDAAARAFFVGQIGHLPSTAGQSPARAGARNSLVGRLALARGGVQGEGVRARIVGETCVHRPLECAAQLAHWRHEVPMSPARRRLIAEIRANPSLASHDVIDRVPELARLYAPVPIHLTPARALRLAPRATELFVRHYSHAAPFSRQTLLDLWRRCAVNPAHREACATGRADAERQLGDLSARGALADPG